MDNFVALGEPSFKLSSFKFYFRGDFDDLTELYRLFHNMDYKDFIKFYHGVLNNALYSDSISSDENSMTVSDFFKKF